MPLEYCGLLIAFIPIIFGILIMLPFIWDEFRDRRKRVTDKAPYIHKVSPEIDREIRLSIWKDNSPKNLRRLQRKHGMSMTQLRQIRAEVNPLRMGE